MRIWKCATTSGRDLIAFRHCSGYRKGLLHLGDANKTLEEVRKELQRDIARAPYRKEVEDGIRKFVVDVAEKRIEIRGKHAAALEKIDAEIGAGNFRPMP